jgi:hypothetical protein
MEVGGEQRRLVAAGAGADLDDRIAVVERVARDEVREQANLELGDRGFEASELGARLGGHFGVVNGNELAHVGELVFTSFELGRQFGDGSEAAVLPSELRELLRVAESGRVSERALDFVGACERGR